MRWKSSFGTYFQYAHGFRDAIALALPTFGLALAGAVNQEVNRLDAPPQLSVLTEASLTLEDAKQLAKKLSDSLEWPR